jgi:hypothetical protein
MRMIYNLITTIKVSTNGIIFWIFLLATILINGCSSTYEVRSWSSSDEFDQKFNRFLVLGLVNNTSRRFDVESEMVLAARKVNLNSRKGLRMFPPELGNPFGDMDRLQERLKEMGFDAILTVAIINVTSERFIPPERRYVPMIGYNRFRNYYYATNALVISRGYFVPESRYFLETNLYEVGSGSLIWSGRSNAFMPQDFDRFLPRYAKRLFKDLQNRGIIDD